jgi:hypothetical protein
MVRPALVAAGEFDRIRELAAEAIERVRASRA